MTTPSPWSDRLEAGPQPGRHLVKRTVFWSAIGLGLLASAYLWVRVPARSTVENAGATDEIRIKGPIEVYLELLQSYDTVAEVCREPEGHAHPDQFVDSQKRFLRTLDLSGVATERHRQGLARLQDGLMTAWDRIAVRLRAAGDAGQAALQGDLQGHLEGARVALRATAKDLIISRSDLEASLDGRSSADPADPSAPGRRHYMAALVRLFDEIMASSPVTVAQQPSGAPSEGERDEAAEARP